jgi:hypothetical protein
MSTLGRQNKTLQKTHDLSGDIIQASVNVPRHLEQNDSLLNFLEQDAGSAYKRQWHRLERGLRLNRLRKFSNDEATRLNLTEMEKTTLYNLLVKSLEKKQLNSKTAVIYDSEKEAITEIKGLVMHRNSEGILLFQIVDKQKGVTFRRKKSAAAAEDKEQV